MMPPICEICSKRFDPDKEGGLVYFKETGNGREFDRRVAGEGITGHPPDALWFCGEHTEEAKRLSGMNAAEALRLMRKS